VQRRTLLTRTGALVGTALIDSIAGRARPRAFAQAAPLRAKATAQGLFYGSETGWAELLNDSAYAARYAAECGILVPGNELKWRDLRPTPDTFDFSGGDALAGFAHTNGMLMRGHTLVWHHELPPWFAAVVNAANAESLFSQHISTVVGHYAGQLHSWDVLNEVINVPDRRADHLRNTPWLQLLGPDHLALALRLARAADPVALLGYNEFGLEYHVPADAAKRAAVLALLQQLLAAGAPLDYLGLQSHLTPDVGSFEPAIIQAFLDQVAGLGLRVIVTELDVRDATLPADIAARDAGVAQMYAAYLAAVLPHPAVLGVVTWGLTDKYSWLRTRAARSDGLPVRPLPLDADLQPKPAYTALAQAFDALTPGGS